MSIIPVPRKRPRPDFSLNIINIVFLLLLFYLTTGSMVKQNELETDVPVTSALPLEKLPRPLLLVTVRGELFVDGRPVKRDEVAAAARDAFSKQKGAAFLNVLADRSMPASTFLEVMASVGASGLPLRIVTLRRPLEEEPAH
jgi:biopolymer transport protein ExbD